MIVDGLGQAGQWPFLTLWWHQATVDLFATMFNNKLPQLVSPDQQHWVVDVLSLPWCLSDTYTFPPVAILGKVVGKLLNSPCNRIILIPTDWPNMLWFWDLVNMSGSPLQ